MRTSIGERLQAATGLIFVLLSLIWVFALPPAPTAGASANEIASYYSTHNGAVQALSYLYMLAVLFSLWFIGYLRTVFARAEGEPHHLSTLFFGAGVAAVAVQLAFSGMALALPGQAADPRVIKPLSDVVHIGLAIGLLPLIVHIGTGSVLVLQTGVLPRWVGMFALVVTIVLFLGSFSLVVPSGLLTAGGLLNLLTFLALLLDVLVVSIVLIVKAGSGPKAVETSSATA